MKPLCNASFSHLMEEFIKELWETRIDEQNSANHYHGRNEAQCKKIGPIKDEPYEDVGDGGHW